MMVGKDGKEKLLGIVTAGSSYWIERILREVYPELYPQTLNASLAPGTPKYGTLLSTGIPLTAWIPTALTRSRALRNFSVGVSLFSLPTLIHETIRSALIVSPGLSHRAPAPYVTKAENLPFQTDMTY